MNKAYYEVCNTVKTIICNVTKIPVDNLGEFDNLIELGSDSFVITEVNSHLRETFGMDIPVSLYFEELTTVNAIAEYIMEHAELQEREVEYVQLDTSDIEKLEDVPVFKTEPVVVQTVEAKAHNTHPDVMMLLNQQMQLMNAQIQLLSSSGEKIPTQKLEPSVSKEVKKMVEKPVKTTPVGANNQSKDYVAHKKLDLSYKKMAIKQKECLDKIIAEYTQKTKSSKAYVEKYRKPYVDTRNIAGFRPDFKEMVYQLIFSGSQGSKVYDIDENEYIDIAMDFGVSLFGHNPEFIRNAIEAEAKKGFPLSLISELSGEVAALICKLTGNDRVCFSNSGTEAVIQAIRTARAYTQKNRIVMFSGSYHGTSDAVLGIQSFKSENYGVVPVCTGVPQGAVNDIAMLKYDTDEALEYIENHSGEIAAVLVEPVQSRKPELQPKEFLKKLRKITKRKNIVLIFDEMILGFRVARGGAQEYFDIKADLVSYGKVCGGGMPIGVLSGKEEIMGVLDGGLWNYGDDSVPPYENSRTFVGGTFCHHPLTMAAAKATLTEIDDRGDDLYTNLNKKTAYLANTLNTYFTENQIPIEVTYCGSLFRFVLKGNLELFYYVMIMKNVYIWEGRNCFLSDAHTMEDIEKIIQAVKETCEIISPFFQITESSPDKNFPLSEQQKQMYLYELKNSENSSLRENLCLQVEPSLNLDVLRKAVDTVVDRHEMLNVVVSKNEDSVVPRGSKKNILIELQLEKELQTALKKICMQPFDYKNGPLFQVYSLDLQSGSYLLLTASHLVIDGWSLSVLYQEIVEVYNSLTLGESVHLQKTLSYEEFQISLAEKKSFCDRKQVIDTLRGAYENRIQISLPQDVDKREISSEPHILHIRKKIEDIQPIRRLAGKLKCSSFILMLSAFQIMVKELSNEESVRIGIPLTSQTYFPEFSIIGNHDIVRPFRTIITEQSSLAEIVAQNKKIFEDYNTIMNYTIHDFEELAWMEDSGIDVLFNLDRVPRIPSFAGASVSMEDVDVSGIEYELFFNLVEMDSYLKLDIDYNSNKYSKELVESWGELFFAILSEIGRKGNQCLEDYCFLNKKDFMDCRSNQKVYDENIHMLKQWGLINESDDNEICYYIKRENHEPQIRGSYGFVFLGTNEYDNYNTGWIGKINLDGTLTLVGPSKEMIYNKGRKVSLWCIKNSICENTIVKYCEVEYEMEEGCIVAYLDFTEELDMGQFITFCRCKLEAWEMPEHLYYDKKHTKSRDQEILLQAAFETEIEQGVFDAIQQVLGGTVISRNENLILLGIQSVKMFQIIHTIEEYFKGVKLSIVELYRTPTICGIARMIDNQKRLSGAGAELIKGENVSEFVASQVQKRMYILNQIDEESVSYNLPSILKIEGAFSKESFEFALKECLKRHEMVRSYFTEENGEIICKVQDKAEVNVEYKEVVFADRMNEIIQTELKEFIRPFNLYQAPLIHVCVLESSQEKKYVVMFDFHHIIFDGMSSLVFAKDFARAYRKETMQPLEYTYHDYITMQNRFRKTSIYQEQENYWKEILGEARIREDFLIDYPRRNDKKYTAEVYDMSIEPLLVEKIDQFCLKKNCSKFSFFIAIINLVFQRYQTSNENTFGTVIHGRTQNELYDMIGMFVNTIPLYQKIEGEDTFNQFVGKVNENCMRAYENADVPYDRIVEIAGEPTEGNRNALFDVLLSYQDFEVDSENMLDGMQYEMEEILSPSSKFDMEILIMDQKRALTMKIVYAKELFCIETVKQLSDTMKCVVREVLEKPEIPVCEISGVGEEEKEILLGSFNDTVCDYDNQKTIVDLWEEQVVKTPKNTAVVFHGQSISYQALNKKANQLGYQLRKMGIKPDVFVVLALERSIELMVGIYGVMKAGGTYVPIDMDYPEERVRYILEDCKPKVILYYKEKEERQEKSVILEVAEKLQIPVIDLASEYKDSSYTENLEHVSTPENLMYCIYTSGTSGQPKGVMIPHKAVVNYCMPSRCSIMREAIKDNCIKIASVTNMVFDIFVTEAILSLTNGMEVYLMDEEQAKDGNQATECINTYQIETLQTTPTRIKIWLSSVKQNNPFQSLKYILIGGEKVEKSLVDELVKYTDAKVIDVYGPSETTVWSTRDLIQDTSRDSISIGKPISNTQIYIMDGNRLCGIRMPGELCIGGAGLARGYLNRDVLTEEKFICNPFGTGKIYRTGDLARWNADGTLEYIGRMDGQVKLRGFRIELGEIECVLKQMKGVTDATVINRIDQTEEQELYAYLVGEQVNLDDVRKELANYLPSYMIPAYMMTIPCIPMTKNGKLDRKALPVIEEKSTTTYREPRNATESLLSRIFSEILGRKQIGIDESFFEIGGHSLKATLAVNRIEEETGARIKLKDFFANGTVEQLATLIDRKSESKYQPIPSAEEKAEYIVSPAQERIYMAHVLDEEETAYNMPAILLFSKVLERENVEQCFRILVDRNEILHTSFYSVNSQVMQKIETNYEWKLEYKQVESLDDSVILEETDDFICPFQMSKAPLLRARYVETEDKSMIMIDMHHIVSDGMSIQILKEQFAMLYNGNDEWNNTQLQYRDYSEWVRKHDIEKQKQYWIEEYHDEVPALEMPLDYPRGNIRSFEGNTISRMIETAQSEKIAAYAKEQGVTEYMLFLSGLMITLGKYSRQEDLVVGTPVSGRVHRDLEDIVGMFGNTLALRGKPEEDKRVEDFLQEVKQGCIKGLENQEYPFEDLVEAVCKRRDTSRSPMFDIMFVFEYDESDEYQIDFAEMQEWKLPNKTTKFDILFTIRKGKDGFEVEAEYCRELYIQQTIEYMLAHYCELLLEMCNTKGSRIGELSGISKEEKERLLVEFNDSDALYPAEKTVTALFEEQSARTPENIAVQYEETCLTYKELNQKASRLAVRLQKLGVRRNDFVAFVAERSLEMAVGIYGILKANGAYLPMDPAYPDNRFSYIISDSKAKALVVYVRESELLSRLSEIAEQAGIPLVDLAEEICEEEIEIVESNQPVDYIYCIYTSGTTGRPKGVKLMHYNVVRLLFNDRFQFQFTEKDVWTMFHNFNFDFSVWEFFGATLYGGKLVILSYEDIRDSNAVLEILEKEKVTVFNQVPTSWYQLMESDHKQVVLSLRYLIFGGEALKPEKLREWYLAHSNIKIINMYGITETTVHVTYKEITMSEIEEARSIIGSPIPTLKIYIMNGKILCGIDVPGEICVTGSGVASGYMNLPELTEQKFVDNPFGEGKMYRSGDLARWLPDGNLEYLGRIDEQVKIRGFRIELSEIEAVLRKVEPIRDAVALVKRDNVGDKYIQAYFVSDKKIEIREVKSAIQSYLPDYMIPSRFLQVDEMPMTVNGKLDKKSLMMLDVEIDNEYIAPVTEKDKMLESIFKEILGLPRVSITERFIGLGGDSIKAIRVVSKLREAGYELKVKDLLQYQTIESISKVLMESSAVKEYDQNEQTGEVPLLPIQSRFFNWKLSNPNHYNQAVMLKLNEKIENEKLEKAFEEVWKHHDMLRAVYQGEKQILLGSEEARKIPLLEKRYASREELFAELELENTILQGSLELEKGPLMKAKLYVARDETYLFICCHHLIIDVVSWRIIIEDLSEACKMLGRNDEVQLPKKTASYKEWSEVLKKQEESQQLKEEYFYWKKVVTQIKETPYSESRNDGYHIRSLVFDQEFTHHLLMESGKNYGVHINELLLCAVFMTYSDVVGVNKVGIDIEGHGREGEEYHLAVDRTVGWFTTIYPLVLERKTEIEEQIINIKETFSKVPRKGLGYGILANSEQYELPVIHPEMCFNYLGELDNVENGEQLFDLVPLPIGESSSTSNHDEHNLVINGSVTSGVLTLDLTFDSGIWTMEMTERYLNECDRNLHRIVEHCAVTVETVVTLSDFGIGDLDSNDEDIVSTFLDEL